MQFVTLRHLIRVIRGDNDKDNDKNNYKENYKDNDKDHDNDKDKGFILEYSMIVWNCY